MKPVAPVTAPSGGGTVDACWKEEERALKEVAVAARCFRTTARSAGALSSKSQRNMVAAVVLVRAALAEAIAAETMTFERWHTTALQPGLFDPPAVPDGPDTKH